MTFLYIFLYKLNSCMNTEHSDYPDLLCKFCCLVLIGYDRVINHTYLWPQVGNKRQRFTYQRWTKL